MLLFKVAEVSLTAQHVRVCLSDWLLVPDEGKKKCSKSSDNQGGNYQEQVDPGQTDSCAVAVWRVQLHLRAAKF